ncbi:hypothetical protein [Salinispora arenicola]|uniref:hypothetical protein n=1 Tax=Salinispora arenicola TaxID=168697 RepID=UPI00035C44A9|nr:hypothetical protein [Salinispora arenicola]MCN0180180.1 hypothetical protein [Salinispora arenicola]NIL58682.1 hypothetical protein [Salinispora arenicola]NIL63774.1 hypothetical protein [Salinispora arenicola]
MPSDLDQRLAATLKWHAGGEVDLAPIVEQARRRGRRLRRRRRGLIAGGVAAACAALVAVVLVIPTTGHAPDGAIIPATALALPDAPGQPGAIMRPEVVGADPGMLHFTTDTLVGGAESATWSAGRGAESVEFRGPTGHARFVLARSVAMLDALQQTLSSAGRPQPPTDVRVGGRPGLAWFDPSGGRKLWFVRWQPVTGLWAQLDIYATTRDEATDTASRVRFDGAHRCVVPFRLQSLPPGGRLLECSVTLSRSEQGLLAEGSLVVGDETGRWLTVRARPAPGYAARTGELVAGHYRARRQGSDVLEMFVKPCVVEAFLKGWGNGYTESDGLTVLSGYRPARDLDEPGTW